MVRRTSRRAVTVALTLALLGTAGLVTALSRPFSQAANGPSAAPGPAAAAGQGAAPAGRAGALDQPAARRARSRGQPRRHRRGARDPARGPAAAALLGWAARAGLRATWFAGQPTAMLTARPAVLGAALGVRIDDFRLPGYGVFYASRGSGHVPAPAGRRGRRGRPYHVPRPGPPGRGTGGPGRGRAVPRGVREHLRHPAAVEPGRPGPGPDHRVLRGRRRTPPPTWRRYAARFGLPAFAEPAAGHRRAEH